MLLQLCQKCSAECTHCMVSATKNGKIMDLETINNAIKYINLVNPKTLIITGGEFTEIPDFFNIIKHIYDNIKVPVIVLESNGWWIGRNTDIETEIYNQVLELIKFPRIKSLQISSHKDYYPKDLYDTVCKYKLEIEGYSKKIYVVVDWQNIGQTDKGVKSLTNLGRATNLEEGKNSVGKPNCINIASRAKSFYKILEQDVTVRHFLKRFKSDIKCEYSKFVLYCEMSGYLCKPMIDVDGNIHFGESQFCSIIDSVNYYQDLNQILSYKRLDEKFMDYIKNGKLCNKCNQVRNCDSFQLKTIGLI